MGKFDSLKEPPDAETFIGERLVEELTAFVYTNDNLVIIQGLPACPECGEKLTHSSSLWCCLSCGTEWNDSDMVEALRNEKAFAELQKEAQDG